MSRSRRNIQPSGLHQRKVDGLVLYSHAVVVEPRRLVFISGQLARDVDSTIVGVGDMRAQLHKVLESLTLALEAAGGGLV